MLLGRMLTDSLVNIKRRIKKIYCEDKETNDGKIK